MSMANREDEKKKNKNNSGISRRNFMKVTGVGVGAASVGPFFLFPEQAKAAQKSLKIVQWSHFVPAYDKWFDNVFAKNWGEKHDTNVTVDHIAITEVNARAAAEVSAKQGHDMIMFLEPPPAYEKQAIDHKEVYQEVERKHGKPLSLALRSSYNPKTKKYYAFSDSWVVDPGNYRKDLFEAVGYPNGPNTYEDLLKAATAIRKKFGNPCGIGLSQELDTNMAMRALLWSYGASVQDAHGNVAINSKQTIEALKLMKALYQESETEEVFSWDPSSNNRAMLAGRASYADNAISITRSAELDNPKMSKLIQMCSAPAGPGGRWASEHVMSCYVIWNFAQNKEGAKQFLVDLIGDFRDAFMASKFYNMPSFPSTIPDLASVVAHDPFGGDPPDKYKFLSSALAWSTNVGHPGYATAGINEAFNTYVIPTMFAKVARNQATPEAAAADAEKECKRIWAKWKEAGMM
jgi:multiple sugar transport system substrate-binding protein